MDVSKPYDILTVHSCTSPIYKFLVLAGSLGSAVLGPESLPSTHTLGKSRGKGSIGVAEWTQGLKVPPRPPTQLLAVEPQDPSLCWKDPAEAQPVPVCLPPPGLAPPPRQPPLPKGPGERVPCQSEVLKSWTHLVHAGGGHCTQWTPLLTALDPHPHQGGGLYAEPAGCQMCNAPCTSPALSTVP